MGRVFALSDIHGQRGLWEQIKDYLNLDDTLYFLGDAIDRGPDGYAIMKELMNDRRVIYLKGNHEELMENALFELRRDNGMCGDAFTLWGQNGCYPTFSDWMDAGANYGWIHILHKLPLEANYVNAEGKEIRMSHAGFTPGARRPTPYDLIWDRRHFFDTIPEECDEIIVHGHTPTVFIKEDFDEVNRLAAWNEENGRHGNRYYFQEKEGAIIYGNGQKICIDCGSFATGHTVLLDLDTLEVIPFDADLEDYELEIEEGDYDSNG